MNRKARVDMAHRLLMVAAAHGGNAITIEDRPNREIRLEVKFQHVSVSMDVSGRFGPGQCAHWYDAKRGLAPLNFWTINTVHKRKATLYRNDNAAFELAFEQACKAVADGSAFAS